MEKIRVLYQTEGSPSVSIKELSDVLDFIKNHKVLSLSWDEGCMPDEVVDEKTHTQYLEDIGHEKWEQSQHKTVD